MKTLLFVIAVLLCRFSIGQNIVEIPFKSLDKDYVKLVNSIKELENSESKQIISLDDSDFEKFNDLDTRYLMFFKLSIHYAALKEYDKCFEILKKGQNEGFFFLFNYDGNYPSYLKELKKFDGYQSLIEQNETLKKEKESTGKAEYMIQLPKDYNENIKYPLMLIMHGGGGCIPDLQYLYNSPKLKNDFIVAYFQGSDMTGSYHRAFSRNWLEQITIGFNQIISKCSVDTTKIILAGPSAGGVRSIHLAYKNEIPARGLLLNFPVIPGIIKNTTYLEFKERDLKVVQLCGENDWAIQQQKEFAYWLDRYMIKNRFVVFPEIGHGFPANFQHHLETSIEFILMEDL
jgi:hypothetical protein